MKKKSKWTQFMDMHSGGGLKLDWSYIYIEAPQKEAEIIFYNKFDRNPNRITCTCCGEDYSVSESDSLEEVTAYNRGCDYVYRDPKGKECKHQDAYVIGKGLKKGYTQGYEEKGDSSRSYRKYVTLKKYLKEKEIKIIYDKDILPNERVGNVPSEGYVWVG